MLLRKIRSLSQSTQLQSQKVSHTKCASSKVDLKPTSKEVPKKETISKQVVSTKKETIKKGVPNDREATEPKIGKKEAHKMEESKKIIKEPVIETKKEVLEKASPKLDYKKLKGK